MKRKKKLWIIVILMAVAALLIYGVFGGKEGHPGGGPESPGYKWRN